MCWKQKRTVVGGWAESGEMSTTPRHGEEQRPILGDVAADHQKSISWFEPCRRKTAGKSARQGDHLPKRPAPAVNHVDLYNNNNNNNNKTSATA